MELKIPENIKGIPEKEIAFAYRVQEVLQQLHNQIGEQYDSQIISHQEWIDFRDSYFFPRSGAIGACILKNKDILKKDTSIIINLDTGFE